MPPETPTTMPRRLSCWPTISRVAAAMRSASTSQSISRTLFENIRGF
jgi:hypothetical protein